MSWTSYVKPQTDYHALSAADSQAISAYHQASQKCQTDVSPENDKGT